MEFITGQGEKSVTSFPAGLRPSPCEKSSALSCFSFFSVPPFQLQRGTVILSERSGVFPLTKNFVILDLAPAFFFLILFLFLAALG